MREGASPGGCTGSADPVLAALGRIDIYLLDQIMRGRISPEMRILDAGCGPGRNARYLMSRGADLFGVDADARQIDRIRELAAKCAPELPLDRFSVGDLADLPFADGDFDAVVCSAVLHFARDAAHCESMVDEMWRALKNGGVFFARLATTIGIEALVVPVEHGWYRLPDGSDRFLVDQPWLEAMGERLGATLLDPIKTTNVQNLRAMTTWVLRKG